MLLRQEILRRGRYIIRAMYTPFIWGNFGSKLFLHIRHRNIISRVFLNGFHCFFFLYTNYSALFCEDDNTDTSVNHVRPICYTHKGGTITNGAECHKYVSKNNESLLKYHSLQNIEPATQTESVHQVSVVFVKCRSYK